MGLEIKSLGDQKSPEIKSPGDQKSLNGSGDQRSRRSKVLGDQKSWRSKVSGDQKSRRSKVPKWAGDQRSWRSNVLEIKRPYMSWRSKVLQDQLSKIKSPRSKFWRSKVRRSFATQPTIQDHTKDLIRKLLFHLSQKIMTCSGLALVFVKALSSSYLLDLSTFVYSRVTHEIH